MTKLAYLFSSLLFIILSSIFIETSSQQQEKSTYQFSKQEKKPAFYNGMITIKLKEGSHDLSAQRGVVRFNISSLDVLSEQYEVNLLEKRFRYNPEELRADLPDLSRIYRIEFPEHYPVSRVAREFSLDSNIEYAEPIPIIYLCEVPNDSLYSEQSFLTQIKADSAWDIHKGEDGQEKVVVAIVDSGTDWDHVDLVDNIWQNMGEDADSDGTVIQQNFPSGEWIFDPDDENGIDDDNNGFIDDFIGWNFLNNNNDVNPTPGFPFYGHGTHTAGLACATTNNNKGIASVSWNLKILPIDMGIDSSIHYAYDAIIYAAEHEADIISNSWGVHFYAQANHEAISYARGLGSIIVAAGGGDYVDNFYPSDYPGVVSVGAVDEDDQKPIFSGFGPNLWVCSPGVSVLSAVPDDQYERGSGVSMATPIVSGLLGLVKSYNPDWTNDQIIKQVLATADDIDSVNPGYENMLGSGRINAYRALKDTGVSLAQEISIHLLHTDCHDSDSNHVLDPGDDVSFSFKLRNYNFGVGFDSAVFTLISPDPDIIILDDYCVSSIPADDYFSLDEVFKIKISEDAEPHIATLNIIPSTDVEIIWGDTLSVEIPVAPQGMLVYQGEGSGNTFSGDFINEYLVEQGHEVVYTSNFPFSLKGFDVVFLSYGNYGPRLDDGVVVTEEMAEAMLEYLKDMGRIYVECGSFFSSLEYYGYPIAEELMELFGVEEYDYSYTPHLLNDLNGLSGSICQDMEFHGTTQNLAWFVNTMVPNNKGTAAFEEGDYGVVAVQGVGEYQQRTFVFSYALAHLVDNDNGTREELLQRIFNFLFVVDGDEENVSKAEELQIFPNPFFNLATIEFGIQKPQYVEINIYSQAGKLIESIGKNFQPGEHTYIWDASGLPSGIYFIHLKTGNLLETKKIIKLN